MDWRIFAYSVRSSPFEIYYAQAHGVSGAECECRALGKRNTLTYETKKKKKDRSLNIDKRRWCGRLKCILRAFVIVSFSRIPEWTSQPRNIDRFKLTIMHNIVIVFFFLYFDGIPFLIKNSFLEKNVQRIYRIFDF